jgi:hypothetical protein
MRPIARLAAASALALGTTWIGVTAAVACSCAWTELPQAIAEAEVAIIGTLAVADAPNAGAPAEPTDHVWTVERSRDPMSAGTITIGSWPDDGASCGITFASHERWLVLAYQADGGLETNGCMRNVRLADAAPDELDAIDALVVTPVSPSDTADPAPAIPTPLLVALGAVAVVAAISILAFRRGGPGASA